jgi:hypothetical protein
MEDIFGHLHFVIVYIDGILVCSYDTKEHKAHLEYFFIVVLKHGLAL